MARAWKGRSAIAIRLARLIYLAQEYRRLPPLNELAKELGVSTRTVRRDLHACEAARVPLPKWDYEANQKVRS